MTESKPSDPSQPRRRAWRRRGAVALILLLAPLLTGAWVAQRSVDMRDELRAAATLMTQMRRQLRAKDLAGARKSLDELRRHTSAAAGAARDPALRLAARLPGPAANLAAARVIAQVVDDVATDALPALLGIAELFGSGSPLRPDGSVDLRPIADAAPGMDTAHRTLRRALDRVAAIRTAGLRPEVATAVTELTGHLRSAVAMTDAGRRATAILPTMLGGAGRRSYLVLFQNPAEVRATGGMSGAFAVVTADRGRLRMVRQGTASADLRSFDRPVLPLPAEIKALYGEELGLHPANVNLSPHYPTAAALTREMYRRRSGQTVDGVIATDPIALSYLLRATGPVVVPGGRLTAANAVRTLLASAYARFATQERQNRFFAAAARAVFGQLTRSLADPGAVFSQLSKAAAQRRILIWSAHRAEREAIGGTVLDGVLPADTAGRHTVGVFLNDGGASKLGFYLTQSARLTAQGCPAGGYRRLGLRVTLGSTAPRRGLPRGVLSVAPVPDPYTTRALVHVFAPTGGGIVDARLNGRTVPLVAGTDHGRMVVEVTVDVPAGRSRVLDVTLVARAKPAPRPALRLWTTPMVTPWRTSVTPVEACQPTA